MLYTNAKDLRSSQIPRSRFKGSSLPQYGYGAMLTQAGKFLGSDQGSALLGNLGQLGTAVGSLDATDGDMNPYLAAGSGALKGAQLGAKLGSFVPGVGNLVGAGVGALAGGAAGLYKERQQQAQLDEAEEAKLRLEQQRKRALELANLQASKAVLSTYPTQGVADAGFMAAYGGIIKKFEDGGVVQPKGDPYEYKKVGTKYLTRKRGNSNWINAQGTALDAIRTKVYGESSEPAPQAPVEQKEAPLELMDYPENTGGLPTMYPNPNQASAQPGPMYNPVPTGGGFSNEIPGNTSQDFRVPAAAAPAPITAETPAPMFAEKPMASSVADKYSDGEVKEMQRLLKEPARKVPKKVVAKKPKQEPKTVEEVEVSLVKNDETAPIVLDDPGSIDLGFAKDFYKKNGVNKDYVFVVDKPSGAMYQVSLDSGEYKYLDQVGLGKNVGDRDTSKGRGSGKGTNQTQAGWVKINREAEFTQRNKNYGDEFNGFSAYVNGSWKEVPTGIHGTMSEDCGRVSGGCTRMNEELEDSTRGMLDKNTLLYYTSDNSAGIPMQAMGGPTDPPQFDMSLLAGNTLPAPNQMTMSSPDVVTGYSDQELAINRAKGNQVAFNQRADIVGENLNSAYQYAKENPLDAVQVGLGATAIAAEGIPLAGTAVSGIADGINAGISGGRAAYYANKGDTSNAAFYTTAAALDGAAAIPGLGNAAGASKIAMLLNKANHVAHAPIHAAHTGAKAITAYKAGNLGYGAANSSYAMGGKIPTESADYLAEGGEVIQHAMNDRPDTDQNGDIRQLNSNTSKFVGDSHDAASQGIGVANDEEARIYSKRLYAPKNLVAKLNKL